MDDFGGLIVNREKCEELRKIRLSIATTLGIPEAVRTEPCNYKGECKGTCPACYMEERKLMDRAYSLYKDGIIQMTYSEELKQLQNDIELRENFDYTLKPYSDGFDVFENFDDLEEFLNNISETETNSLDTSK